MEKPSDSTEECGYCSLCGASMPHEKPWVLWCQDCRTTGLKKGTPVMGAALLLAMGAGYLAGSLPLGLFVAVFILALAFVSVVDANLRLLPDDVTLPLLWAGLLVNLYGGFTSLPDAVLGAAGGYGALWLLYWVTWLATKEEAFGYGDLKLTAALGAWLGWQALPGILIGAALCQLLVSLGYRALARKKEASIPFGPSLSLAGAVAMTLALQS